jgi:hypothetical protein
MTDSHGLTRYRQKRNFARARPRPRVVFDGGEVTPDPTDAGALEGARRAALPKSFEPQLATLGDSAPEGDEWLHEMKLDGYRILCRIDGGDVRLLSRNGKDWTDRFAEIAEAAAALPCERALIDGEVVVLDRKGMSHFQSLQQALRRKAGTRDLHWFAFDIVQRPRVLSPGVPIRPRGHHIETRGLAVPERPRPRLAQDQVHAPPGIRDRRLHRAGRLAHGLRRTAPCRQRRGRQPGRRRPCRYRLHERRSRFTAREAREARAGDTADRRSADGREGP